jgi:hypothetical protein
MDTKVEWTRQDIADLRELMKVDNPAQEAQFIRSVSMSKSVEGFTEADVRQVVQDMLDILPFHIAIRLPDIGISFIDTAIHKSENANGTYNWESHRIQVTTWHMKDLSGEELRRELHRVLSHEVMHWVHMSSKGPAADAYRQAITNLYEARTAGGSGGRWHNPYASYNDQDAFDAFKHKGFEIPTTCYELWANHADLAGFAHLEIAKNSVVFREMFFIVHSIFNHG